MIPAKYDLFIDEGADFYQYFTFLNSNQQPIDITGATATAMMRKSFADPSPLFTFSFSNGGTNGVLTMSLLLASTENLIIPPRGQRDKPLIGVWDLFFVDTNGNVTGIAGSTSKMLRGDVFFYSRATR
jgi:hypothetical protein